MIDASYLPGGYTTGVREGLVAAFYPDGQLKHLGYYTDGSCASHWALYLDQGKSPVKRS